jgi:hypothetical protein
VASSSLGGSAIAVGVGVALELLVCLKAQSSQLLVSQRLELELTALASRAAWAEMICPVSRIMEIPQV